MQESRLGPIPLISQRNWQWGVPRCYRVCLSCWRYWSFQFPEHESRQSSGLIDDGQPVIFFLTEAEMTQRCPLVKGQLTVFLRPRVVETHSSLISEGKFHFLGNGFWGEPQDSQWHLSRPTLRGEYFLWVALSLPEESRLGVNTVLNKSINISYLHHMSLL